MAQMYMMFKISVSIFKFLLLVIYVDGNKIFIQVLQNKFAENHIQQELEEITCHRNESTLNQRLSVHI